MGVESISLNPQASQSRHSQMPGSEAGGELGGDTEMDQTALGCEAVTKQPAHSLWTAGQQTDKTQWPPRLSRKDMDTGSSKGLGTLFHAPRKTKIRTMAKQLRTGAQNGTAILGNGGFLTKSNTPTFPLGSSSSILRCSFRRNEKTYPQDGLCFTVYRWLYPQ